MSKKKKDEKPTPEREERLGRCKVGGWGISKDGRITIVEPRELPRKRSKRKAS